MSFTELVTSLVGRGGPRMYECRHCGATLLGATAVCPYCGPTDVVTFDIEG